MITELQTIVDWFARFPGIGERTSEKLVMHLIDRFSPQELEKLSNDIKKLINLTRCHNCHTLANSSVCENCTTNAKSNTIMVVENYFDCIQIMQSNSYKGLFHITNGLINFAKGIDPQMLYLNDLLDRLDGINEVIIATNATIEGEITATYLREIINKFSPEILVTRIAYGIPVGSDFKYTDSETIKRAIANRTKLS